ncbi:hypothetical protein GGQ74_002885 [Desulfobaculum xiamenense]|uniref:Uncharacterized protein n=1 Tax=Desulfobaculum xiamenense TaxID=995050 RepID=A0A846QLZ6_9BACT|nr:hypothetical protein [Desulfobaculum xiamenense]NJB69188.1 hypothetical protein [Desulfobaculum xiamenense]
MMASPHALCGAVAGARSGSVAVAAALGFALHLLVDCVPSWEPWFINPAQSAVVLGDSLLALVLVTVACRRAEGAVRLRIAVGAAFGVLPDLLHLALVIGIRWKWLAAFEVVHQGVQRPAPPELSMALQAVVVLAGWMLLRREARRKIATEAAA